MKRVAFRFLCAVLAVLTVTGTLLFSPVSAEGDGTETLTFKLPKFNGTTEPAAPQRKVTVNLSDENGWDDAVQLMPASGESSDMPYRINSDGIKWLAWNEEAPQLWIENNSGTPFSLAAHAPVETLLPIGLRTPQEKPYTFSLRETQVQGTLPTDISAVWLIDQEAKQAVNLLDGPYRTHITESSGRFFLQLNGTPPLMSRAATRYQVYVSNHVLHVLNTKAGDTISVHLPDGTLLQREQADDDHWQAQLPEDGVYLVQVEEETHKVIALP